MALKFRAGWIDHRLRRRQQQDSATVTGPDEQQALRHDFSGGRSRLGGVFDIMIQSPGSSVRLNVAVACRRRAAKGAGIGARARAPWPARADDPQRPGRHQHQRRRRVYPPEATNWRWCRPSTSHPIVDDPYDSDGSGREPISDFFVYAMGGKPLTALNIAAFPVETLARRSSRPSWRRGGRRGDAGVSIVGGHTIKSASRNTGWR